MRFYTQQKQHN